MTVALHALWSGASAWLWAENSDLSPLPPPRRGRRPKVAAARAHPFAVPAPALVEVLAGMVDASPQVPPGTLTLLLPTVGAGPLASAQLFREPPEGEPILVPWVVPAVPVDAEPLVTLAERLEPPVTAGDSLFFVGRTVEIALELAARGRVMPALVETPAGYQARWRPVLAGDDVARLRALARSMPGSCRAEVTAASPGGREPGALVCEVVEGTVDRAARSALAEWSPFATRRGRRPSAPPAPPEAWLAGLTGDPAVAGNSGELAKLAAVLDEWRSSAGLSSIQARVCLRLDPPPDDAPPGDDDWHVEFLLQANDDPSALVPAEQVWGRVGPLPQVVGDRPEEVLLEGLGRASRLHPPIEAALASPRPDRMALDAAGAAAFLRDGVPLLDQAGFGVLVPPWWRSGRARLALRLKARTRSSPGGATGAGLGMDAICDYRWQVAVGDASLTAAELRALARLKQPLVRVRGQWVELREQDIAAALAALDRRGDGRREMEAGEVLRTALGLVPAPGGLAVAGVEADGWLGQLIGGAADRRLEPVPTPRGFAGDLRPYQERGLAWLSFLGGLGLGACLADDMGLGKTAQLLALLVAERSAQAPAGRRRGRAASTLVVCPMSVVGNWQREAARFAPSLTVHVHHGVSRLTGAAFAKQVAEADVVLTTYALAARDRNVLASLRWGRVVLDEAQNVKNSAARQTQAVRNLPARQRVALTGTPVENRLSELWSIMQFLNPGLLGSERAFRERFALPIERDGDEVAASSLRRVTGPFVLRRLKTDRSIIADLPEKLDMKVFCNLTREQATLYQAVVDDMLCRIEDSEGMERRGLVLATMLKLKQVCNHPAQFLGDGSALAGRSGKLARLGELLEEVLAEGDRALVFTQFAEMGTMLRGHLSERLGGEVLWLHGGTTKRARDEMVARFQSQTGPAVFLLSIKAGGTGLNLTAANHVVHFDRWWNPAVEDQATDRAFRIGQRRNVQVRKFVCAGTLEERIDVMIEKKRALAEHIVGTGEAWLTELSTAALRQLVALSADAVAEG